MYYDSIYDLYENEEAVETWENMWEEDRADNINEFKENGGREKNDESPDAIIIDGGKEAKDNTIINAIDSGEKVKDAIDINTTENINAIDGGKEVKDAIDGGKEVKDVIDGGKEVELYEELPVNECAFKLGEISICSSPHIQEKMREYLKEKNPEANTENIDDVLDNILKITNSKSESALLSNKEFTDYIGYENAIREKQTRFKPFGPKNNKWFDNMNIDEVLNQWMVVFKGFYNYQFHMINFAELNKPLHTITPSSLEKRGFNCCGCVINTDRYNRGGEHWMALFADFRDRENATVEFFNSSGNSPQTEIAHWIVKTATDLNTFCEKVTKIYNKIRHQKSDTECGPYSVYYIYKRLKGISAQTLMEKRIPDEKVFKFRSVLFRDAK
jgi:hypothetical protein